MDNEKRKQLVDLIKFVEPFDELEHRHIDDAISWIKSGIEICRIKKPDVPLKHLVCYCVLLDLDNHKILLVDHIKSGRLLPPGGHADVGEMPHETVKREVNEELGLEAAFITADYKKPFFVSEITTVGKAAGHQHVDLWYLLKGNIIKKIDKNRKDYKKEFYGSDWYDFDKVLSMPIEKFDPNLHRLIGKIKQKLI